MVRAGIDLGAHSLRLIVDGEGVVFDESSVVAFNEKGDVLAIGEQAYDLRSSRDRTIRLVRPIRDQGVDTKALEAMLSELCYEFRLFRLFQKTTLLLSYSSAFSEEDILHLKQTLLDLGASQIYFDPEIWMAAVGSGLDLFLPVSSCVLSVGFSNCDIAIFRQGQRIYHASNPSLNGRRASELAAKYLLRHHDLIPDEQTLDLLIQSIGAVRLSSKDQYVRIKGRLRDTEKQIEIPVSQNEMAAVLAPFARELGLWVSSFVRGLPENIQLDLSERGIVASGGTMKMLGLADQIGALAGCPVYCTDEPDRTVSRGMEALLETIGR